MPRKIAVPAEQLDRLKDLYNQERDALVVLAHAEETVTSAEQHLAVAQEALREAQAGADAAYQALVGLVGPGLAAELTGRGKTGKRSSRPTVPGGGATERSRAPEDGSERGDVPPAALGALAA
jgi:hypothetical protein